jgi:lipopolysaccharide transport system permease protein
MSKVNSFSIEPQKKFSIGFEELWNYRELFFIFTWREVRVRYKQAALGVIWAILQPLAMMLVFTLVFSKGLQVKSEALPYPLFAYSGLMIWNIFSNGLQNAANSMVLNANMIKKIYFPRLVIPISSILVTVFDFFMALIIYIGILFYFGYEASILRVIIYLPVSVILTVLTTFGLGSFLAALNVKYRDFQYAIPFMIQFLLFINPVLYSTSIFQSPNAKYFMALNPISTAINISRAALNGTPLDLSLIFISSLSVIAFLILGIYTFRKTETYFADIA